jgi:DNA-binding LacI/PurR family transcriptional regulator
MKRNEKLAAGSRGGAILKSEADARRKKRSAKRTITMDEIARLAQVSKPTVSRALQDSPLVNRSTKEKIAAIAAKHGYTVNRNARRLWGKRANTIAVILQLPPSGGRAVSAPFIFQLLADTSRALANRHQDVLLRSAESHETEAYQRMLAAKAADGLIFLGQGAHSEWLNDLARTNTPLVVWGAVDDTQAYCAVGSDNFKGGLLVGQRFAGLGRKRALFVGNRAHAEMELRRMGLEAGLRGERAAARIVDLSIPDFAFDTAHAAVRDFFAHNKQPIDAIFAASDTVAMAAIVALREARLRVPEDVSVIGYNDSPFAAHFAPPLSTVRQDTHRAGALLVEKLFQILDGEQPTSVKLATELVIRQT